VVAHETTAQLMREMRQPTGVLTPQQNVFDENKGFLKAGYTQPPPGTSGQGTARLKINVEIVWNELK
jgi:hypothetical protein